MNGGQPDKLAPSGALRLIREIAKDSGRIFVVQHARKRQAERNILWGQIVQCCRKGTITEGPYLNAHGNWQVNLYRHAAGQELTCSVAIDWPDQLVVVTVFAGRS